MKTQKPKTTHRSIVISSERFLTATEEKQIREIAKKFIAVMAVFDKESESLITSFRDIVGYENPELSYWDALDHGTLPDYPEKIQGWVDFAKEVRHEWALEELKAGLDAIQKQP